LLLKKSPYEGERQKVQQLHKSKFQDNWYRFLVNKIVSGCEKPEQIHQNQVTFVTFNYDTSLEHHLMASLQAYDPFKAEALTFLSGRVLHVYGRVSENEVGVYNPLPEAANLRSIANTNVRLEEISSVLGQFNNGVERAYLAAGGIRVIEAADKEQNKEILENAQMAIQDAVCVYILGYGFDDTNSRRLRLDKFLDRSKNTNAKAVMFTNYGDINRINKRASWLFFRDFAHFIDPSMSVVGVPTSSYVEKSARTVYDALDLDFESLEQKLIAGSAI